MIIQTKDSDGSVVLFGNPACPPAVKPGYTIRTVDSLPTGPGQLLWQGGALVRYVAPLTPTQTFAAAVAAGYTVPDVTPALVLDLGDAARAQFTGLKVLLDGLLASGQLAATSSQAIADKAGALHSLPVSQLDAILLGYGAYYAGLYNALHAAATAPAPTA